MQKYLLYTDTMSNSFDSLKEMFQFLSGEGHFIKSLEDGVIVTNLAILNYTLIENTGLKNILIDETKIFRQELRDSVSLLMKQGIPVDKNQLKVIGDQFKFLGDDSKKIDAPEPVKDEISSEPIVEPEVEKKKVKKDVKKKDVEVNSSDDNDDDDDDDDDELPFN